jgi:Carboxypeptidase regulatory-like domain
MRVWTKSAVVVVAASTVLTAQSTPQAPSASRPARDTPAQTDRTAPQPTGRITGRVLASDTGRPVRRARVLLNASELPGGRGVLTDDNGLFDFLELPAGRYTLGVSKSGFVGISYGQRRPLQPGTPLQLADGQAIRGIEFRLPPGSVIAGHVFDEAGDPLPGATVRILQYRFAQGSRQLVPAGAAQTDDRGEYRVWGLNPGEYYVTAVARNFTPPGGPLNGRFGGPFGGRGGPSPNVGGTPAPEGRGNAPEQTGYAPTYFPGVESVSQARPVTVGLSAQALDIDFGVLLVQTSRVTGRVISSEGEPVSTGNIALFPEGQQTGRQGAGAGFTARIQWDGGFAITNVPPGRYILRARGDDWEVPQFALMPVTVSGPEVSGLNVMLAPGGTISGSLTFERSQLVAPDPTQFRVTAPSADGGALGPQQNVRVGQDGRFSLEGVPVGTHWIRTQTPRGWMLKSVTFDGRDVTDIAVDVRSGQQLSSVSIVFTDKISEINGIVANEQGTPVTEFTMLAFPTDTSLWHPQSRQIMTARPDQNGRYQLRGLPPGEYLLAPVDPTEAGEWFDPAYLDEHRAGAVRVTLGAGDIKSQDVRAATR